MQLVLAFSSSLDLSVETNRKLRDRKLQIAIKSLLRPLNASLDNVTLAFTVFERLPNVEKIFFRRVLVTHRYYENENHWLRSVEKMTIVKFFNMNMILTLASHWI